MLHSLRKNLVWIGLASLWLLSTAALAQVTVQGQTNTLPDGPLDLEEAIGIALRNNPQIKQAELQVQASGYNYDQAKWQRWPSLIFNASQGFNSGRNIDPFTNQFVQQNVTFNNYQLSSSVNIFNGFQTQNTIKQNKLNLDASQKELEATRNDVMLNVALSYLQVLSSQELIEVARQQVGATQLQLDRTQRLVDAGTLAESNVYDLRAQLANDELTLVNAQNDLELAKLNLKQFMNVPANQQVEVAAINAADPSLRAYDATVQEVYDTAIRNLPQAQAASLRVQAAERGIEVAKGTRLPSLFLSGSFSTAYSSAAPKQRYIATGTGATTTEVPSQSRFVQIDGVRVPLIETISTPNGAFRDFRYFDQLDFNRNASVNLGLRIPIFNNYQARYQISNAIIQQKNVQFQGQIVDQQVRQNVEQAYINMSNSAKRYTATTNQVAALQEAFRVAESRFSVGAINSVEYNIAKANLDRARANLIQTKYDYLFRTKILDFYMNRPLVTE